MKRWEIIFAAVGPLFLALGVRWIHAAELPKQETMAGCRRMPYSDDNSRAARRSATCGQCRRAARSFRKSPLDDVSR